MSPALVALGGAVALCPIVSISAAVLPTVVNWAAAMPQRLHLRSQSNQPAPPAQVCAWQVPDLAPQFYCL